MALNTYNLGNPEPKNGWLISTWDQGFSPTEWQADNVYHRGAATVLRLDGAGYRDIFAGAEVQSGAEAGSGTWAWNAKAPDMVPGTVFGMFLFQANWQDARLEFDFEFVGDDPTTVELVTHMAMADGRIDTAFREVKLDFDPSAGFHLYEISLDGSSAAFRINGSVVATFDREDFGGYWRTGEVRSHVSLWAAKPSKWAGTIDPSALPIEAEVLSAGWSSRVMTHSISWAGTNRADRYHGTAKNDILDGGDGADQVHGEAGSDRISGAAGNDGLFGWNGADRIYGGLGNDRLDGGTGVDRLEGGTGNDTYIVTVGDTIVEVAGAGTDTVQAGYGLTLGANLENLVLTGTSALSGTGNNLANRLTGNAAANTLKGMAGHDSLSGGSGNDVLTGGAGRDKLTGGSGSDDFVFLATSDSGPTTSTRDVIRGGFSRGYDDAVVSGIDANTGRSGNQAFVLDKGGSFSAGEIRQSLSSSGLLVEFNTDSDRTAEMALLIEDRTAKLLVTDFVL